MENQQYFPCRCLKMFLGVTLFALFFQDTKLPFSTFKLNKFKSVHETVQNGRQLEWTNFVE